MPSKSLKKETLSDLLQVPVNFLTGKIRFGMVPQDVMARRDISPACKLVLAAMAMESLGSGHIAISHQALAFLCGLSRSAVLDCLRRLQACGLIEPDGKPVKQVQPYRILHARLINDVKAVELRPAKVIRAVILCPSCKRKRPMLLKSGICRACAWDIKMDRKVRRLVQEEIARTA